MVLLYSLFQSYNFVPPRGGAGEQEQVWLDKLFSLPKDKRFNILPQATFFLGATLSDESKVKISASMKGNKNSPPQ